MLKNEKVPEEFPRRWGGPFWIFQGTVPLLVVALAVAWSKVCPGAKDTGCVLLASLTFEARGGLHEIWNVLRFHPPPLRLAGFFCAWQGWDSTASRGHLHSAKGQWVCFNGYEDFGDPGQKWPRMARRMAQKAIRRLLSRSRWFPTGRILGGFEPGFECLFFFKNLSSGN